MVAPGGPPGRPPGRWWPAGARVPKLLQRWWPAGAAQGDRWPAGALEFDGKASSPTTKEGEIVIKGGGRPDCDTSCDVIVDDYDELMPQWLKGSKVSESLELKLTKAVISRGSLQLNKVLRAFKRELVKLRLANFAELAGSRADCRELYEHLGQCLTGVHHDYHGELKTFDENAEEIEDSREWYKHDIDHEHVHQHYHEHNDDHDEYYKHDIDLEHDDQHYHEHNENHDEYYKHDIDLEHDDQHYHEHNDDHDEYYKHDIDLEHDDRHYHEHEVQVYTDDDHHENNDDHGSDHQGYNFDEQYDDYQETERYKAESGACEASERMARLRGKLVYQQYMDHQNIVNMVHGGQDDFQKMDYCKWERALGLLGPDHYCAEYDGDEYHGMGGMSGMNAAPVDVSDMMGMGDTYDEHSGWQYEVP